MFFRRSVLVIGQGAREHALCWKLAQSPIVDTIYCAPGNGGTAIEHKVQNIAIEATDVAGLLKFALTHEVFLTIVGPEVALAAGIVEAFQAKGLHIAGPDSTAAQLETSKAFAKRFMQQYQLPTARFEICSTANEAYNVCMGHDWARVIKVDGLAAGKGVFVCDTLEECRKALTDIFQSNRFGQAGRTVVVEEKLSGPELSLMLLVDKSTVLPLATSRDYKRRNDGQTGPNTGGMGAYSPVPEADDEWMPLIESTILTPLRTALKDAPFTYRGILYLGIMMHEDKPYLLEFNARFGDPETQVILPRLDNDLFMLMEAIALDQLENYFLFWKDDACVCVNLVADAYPQGVVSREPIQIGELPKSVHVFHAGTNRTLSGEIHANGGRILSVVAQADDMPQARKLAYEALKSISFNGMAYRSDIGFAESSKESRVCP